MVAKCRDVHVHCTVVAKWGDVMVKRGDVMAKKGDVAANREMQWLNREMCGLYGVIWRLNWQVCGGLMERFGD